MRIHYVEEIQIYVYHCRARRGEWWIFGLPDTNIFTGENDTAVEGNALIVAKLHVENSRLVCISFLHLCSQVWLVTEWDLTRLNMRPTRMRRVSFNFSREINTEDTILSAGDRLQNFKIVDVLLNEKRSRTRIPRYKHFQCTNLCTIAFKVYQLKRKMFLSLRELRSDSNVTVRTLSVERKSIGRSRPPECHPHHSASPLFARICKHPRALSSRDDVNEK